MQSNAQEFFVVQKCWFDGPHVEPAVDYMALFTNRAKAEETAYQSAHIHAKNHQAVVRTLLMQSGYAFSAAGKLFWVRRVYAEPPCGALLGSGAHVILTKGVIGGTGNSSSRRGSEVVYNRVFVGPHSSTRALQVMTTENLSQDTMTSWIPFGPLADVMHGWPPQREDGMGEMMMMETVDTTTKRAMMDGQPQQQFHYHTTSPRPAKRHCGQVPNTFAAEPADMCTYMST